MTASEFRQLRKRFRDWWTRTASDIGPLYWVGGALRDELLGRDIKDVDLCVEQEGGARLLAERIASVLGSGVSVVQMGAHYPIWKVVVTDSEKSLAQFGVDRFEVEIAETQSEQFLDAHSRARITRFASLEEDCKRRDFTINSLYWDVASDQLVDCSGWATRDLDARVLRVNPAVDPRQIFSDDPLRILRMVRFAAVLDFDVEVATLTAAIQEQHRTSIISAERIQGEVMRMIDHGRLSKALSLIVEWNLETGLGTHSDLGVTAGLARLEAARSQPEHTIHELDLESWRILCLAMWLHPELNRLGGLKLPRQLSDRVERIVCGHEESNLLSETSSRELRQIARKLGGDFELLALWYWAEAGIDYLQTIKKFHDAQPLGPGPIRLLRGDEVSQLLKHPTGPWLGILLEALEEWAQDFARENARAPTHEEASRWVLGHGTSAPNNPNESGDDRHDE